MRALLLGFVLLVFAAPAHVHAGEEGRRVAILVGVTDYGGASDLPNPARDAAAMAHTLGRLGFDTHILVDPGVEAIPAAIGNVSEGGPIGTLVFFFSGHGLRANGESILAFGSKAEKGTEGTETRLQTSLDRPIATLAVSALLSELRRLSPAATLVILDACRSDTAPANPDEKPGLAPPPRATGTFFAYSAAPGDVAYDAGANDAGLSPFTRALSEELLVPGQDIGVVMRKVRERVSRETAGRQIPWSEDALTGTMIPNAAPSAPQLFALYGPAMRGEAPAQRELGLAYLNGVGVARDVERGVGLLDQAARSDVTAMLALGAFEAARDGNALRPGGRTRVLYEKAVAAGSAEGMFRLAELGRKAAGAKLPPQETMVLYRRAMEAGHQDARSAYLALNLRFAHDKRLSRAASIAALREHAAAGHAASALELGRLYASPGKRETDLKEADFWLEKAARAGLPDALLEQAKRSGEGRDRPADLARSYALTREAAERGSADAMLFLGRMYQHGTGVAPDPREAVTWFRRATEAGSGEAFADLGVSFEQGSGVDVNLAEAVALYRRGEALGDPVSTRYLAVMYERGLGVRRNMDKAIALYERAASLGDATAKGALGVLANNGMLSGAPDTARGAAALRTIAPGDRTALDTFRLAQMTEKGFGGRADPVAAVKLYREAADLGSAAAKTELGVLYKLGKGVPKDFEKAAELWRDSSAAGDRVAYVNLAILYRERGGLEDLAEAGRWSRRGAEAGHPEAMVMHGRNLLTGGEGRPRDVDGGFEWLRKSLATGNGWAAGILVKAATGTLAGADGAERDRSFVALARAAYLDGNSVAQEGLGLVLQTRQGSDLRAATRTNLERRLNGPARGAAALVLGVAALEGRFGSKPEPIAADRYLREAAEAGEAKAYHHLGEMRIERRLPGSSPEEALRWYREGTRAGDPGSINDLGVAYRRGTGVAPDDTEAFRLFKRAAELGYAQAMYNLGFVYERGAGTPVDRALAGQWYQRAADEGIAGAWMGLATVSLNAPAEDRDFARALNALWTAAMSGHPRASAALREVCANDDVPVPVRLRAAALLDRLQTDRPEADSGAALRQLVSEGVIRKSASGWGLHGAGGSAASR